MLFSAALCAFMLVDLVCMQEPKEKEVKGSAPGFTKLLQSTMVALQRLSGNKVRVLSRKYEIGGRVQLS